MPARLVLEVIAGPIAGEVFSFAEHDTFLFGRHDDCHAKLPEDERISRHHFLLEANPPRATLRDLGSRNGTYVNGVKYGGHTQSDSPQAAAQRPAAEVELEDGDRIQVGRTQIQVRVILPVTCHVCGKELANGQLVDSQENDRRHGSDEPCCKACQSALLSHDLHAILRDAVAPLVTDQKLHLDGYELGEVIGHGAMGCVYRATRNSDRLRVAIKVAGARVKLDELARGRFEREIEIVRSLQHHHIVRLLDHGVQHDTPFFVAEFCDGGSLEDLLTQQGGTLPLEVAAPLLLQSLSGLEYAHSRCVVHRDLKPRNILLHQYRGGWIAKIADFGLAKCYATAGGSSMTATGSGGGTYPYMPREQLTEFKFARPPSDIWAVAATFYRLLTGYTPRDGPEDEDPLLVILRDDAVPIRKRKPGISALVAEVIDRALQTEIADRYQSAAEMAEALKEALA